MPDDELRNPFQSEEDAFRILVIIVGAAVLVIACAVLISATLGVIVGIIAVGAGLWKAGSWLAAMLAEPDDEDPSGPRPGDRA